MPSKWRGGALIAIVRIGRTYTPAYIGGKSNQNDSST